ncbi:hypothetical protein Tco_0480355, partial [Tanacetum coccineum]
PWIEISHTDCQLGNPTFLEALRCQLSQSLAWMTSLLAELELSTRIFEPRRSSDYHALKCFINEPLAIPLKEIQIDVKLNFIEELVEMMDREVKRLKQSHIPIMKDSLDAGFKPSEEEEKKDDEDLENEDSEVSNTEEPRVNQEHDENVNSANIFILPIPHLKDFVDATMDVKCAFLLWQIEEEVYEATVVANSIADAEMRTVNEEKGDSVERAATTAASLNADGSKRQDTILGDSPTQTRFERLSKLSNDPPLSRVNTLGSGEDRVVIGHDIGINTGSTSITTASINITTVELVTTASAPVTTAGVSVSTAEPSTPPTTTTLIEDEDLTIAQTLMKNEK